MNEPAKHTPGPWISDGSAIYDSDNTLVASNWDSTLDADTDIANLRLCSAAPDMLEACQAIRDKLDYLQNLWGAEGVTNSMIKMLDKTIAKATEVTP